MLSYRHSFHAGNFGDVLKHIVLVEILEHLAQKDKPFDYIDTHSGAGLYNLSSEDTQKLREFTNGIERLTHKNIPELQRYFDIIQSVNPTKNLEFYPGSPLIAHHFLRPKDKAWLFELHPQDFELLSSNLSGIKGVKVFFENGYEGLNALLPPASRRGLVLVDPSYELKTDYDLVFEHIQLAHKKFSTGTYAIWYPVVERQRIEVLENKFTSIGIKNIQRFELGVSADTAERGMTASGMIVINPPWTLHEKMSLLLPKIAKTLSQDGQTHFKCDVIASE